jgi:hypothetical protein
MTMGKKRKRNGDGPELFIETSGQLRLVGKSVEQQSLESKRVVCFGMTFESEEARRVFFLERLREKLKDPDFRPPDIRGGFSPEKPPIQPPRGAHPNLSAFSVGDLSWLDAPKQGSRRALP